MGIKHAIRSHIPQGVWGALRSLRNELVIAGRHRRGVRAMRRLPSLRIHLGCGHVPKAGWLNVDLFSAEADVALDLREAWPFADGAASVIHSEHLFEHLDHPTEAAHYLTEALRVLRPGALLSIGVPDTEWPIRAYANPKDDYWARAKAWHPADCTTRLEHINFHFRQAGEHKYAWDAETLIKAVEAAGFTDVRTREFDPLLDTEARRVGSLYISARKP